MGQYVVVGWGYGLTVVDVSNPPQPAIVSTASISITARELAVSGHHVFAVVGLGMSSIDLSDPLAPVEVGTLASPAQAEGIAIYGNHALVADREGGLRVIDISRPAAPAAVTVLDLGNLVHELSIRGHEGDGHRRQLRLRPRSPGGGSSVSVFRLYTP